MQPAAHGKRRTLAIVVLSATILAVTLLLTLRGTAANAWSSHPSNAPAAVDSAPGASGALGAGEAVLRDFEQQDAADRKKNVVVGVVLSGPAAGFAGTWRILDSGTVVTLTVNSATNVKTFNNMPPKRNTWVEARVTKRADGSLLVRKFRANKFQPGEVVARLTATAVLTEVLTKYQQYQLMPLDSLLSSRIFRFAIGEDQDEVAVASAFTADTTNFVWAEVNFVSQIPSGPLANPYRTWKWGSSDETGYVNQNALQQIDLLPVQGIYSGTDVIVAVLDTGIDATHPVFAGRVLSGIDLVNGILDNGIPTDQVPQDGPEPGQPSGPAQGHGTHISGIVTLVAPESKILPVRVLDVDGRGDTFVLAKAIEWAVDHGGASVINMSLGSEDDATDLGEIIAYAQSRGVLIVAAAGNDNLDTPQFPADYPGVLGVTAVDDAGHKADFANYGSEWIDLAAPGVAITSTVPVSGSVYYATWSGTSMAVPFVSGAAALVLQASPGALPAEISNRLVQAGRNLDALNPGYVGKLGRLLDVDAAVLNIVSTTSVPTLEPTLESTPLESTPLPATTVAVTPVNSDGQTLTPVPPAPTFTPTPMLEVEVTPAPPTPTQEPTPTSLPPTQTPMILPQPTLPPEPPLPGSLPEVLPRIYLPMLST